MSCFSLHEPPLMDISILLLNPEGACCLWGSTECSTASAENRVPGSKSSGGGGQGHFCALCTCSSCVCVLLRPSHGPQTCICEMGNLASPGWDCGAVVCSYVFALCQANPCTAMCRHDYMLSCCVEPLGTYFNLKHYNLDVFGTARELIHWL